MEDTHFAESERRQVPAPGGSSDRQILFVVSSYEGGAGPPPPAPPPPPPKAYGTGDALHNGAEHQEQGNHWLIAASSLCNSAIGAGVLSFPFAFQQAGLVTGLLITPVIALLAGFSLYVLSKFGERYGAVTYLDLTRKALGRKLASLVSIVLIVYQFGSCVAYTVIIGDTFSSLMAVFGDGWYSDRRVVITIIGVLVAFPLCLLRRLGHLAGINAFATVGFIYAATLVAWMGAQTTAHKHPHVKDVHLFGSGSGPLFSLPIFIFGFMCHSNSVTILYELAFPQPAPGGLRAYVSSSLPRASMRLQAMVAAIATAMVTCIVFYSAVGALGYVAWPTTVTGNILNTLPEGNMFVQVARACIGVVVLNHVPMSHFPARASFEYLTWGTNSATPWVSNVFSAFFVAGVLGVAMWVTNLGSVVHILGGTAASLVAFFVPGLLLVNASVVKHSQLLVESHQEGVGVSEPLLQDRWQRAAHVGLKATGPWIFVPRNSWRLGWAFIGLSAAILVLTVVTSILHNT